MLGQVLIREKKGVYNNYMVTQFDVIVLDVTGQYYRLAEYVYKAHVLID